MRGEKYGQAIREGLAGEEAQGISGRGIEHASKAGREVGKRVRNSVKDLGCSEKGYGLIGKNHDM